MTDSIIYQFDGSGARKLGGPCGWGWVCWVNGKEYLCGSGALYAQEHAFTSNEAEYTALIMAATHALAHGAWETDDRFVFEGDSSLVVNQVNGGWKVKAAHLLPYRDTARELLGGLGRPPLRHIYREANERADMLAAQGRDNYIRRLAGVKHFTRR